MDGKICPKMKFNPTPYLKFSENTPLIIVSLENLCQTKGCLFCEIML